MHDSARQLPKGYETTVAYVEGIVCHAWHLTESERTSMLGSGNADEQEARARKIANIFRGLELLFPENPDLRLSWIRLGNQALGWQSPLQVIESSETGLFDVSSLFGSTCLSRCGQARTVEGHTGGRHPKTLEGSAIAHPDIETFRHLPDLLADEKHQQTLAGLADVDAGRYISHEEMKAWARSLTSPADRVARRRRFRARD